MMNCLASLEACSAIITKFKKNKVNPTVSLKYAVIIFSFPFMYFKELWNEGRRK
jgi:hypothetical protein